MKKVLVLLFLTINFQVSAKTFYVSPTGLDISPGTGSFDHPWATFNKAVKAAYPGDTVFFRGGTYLLSNRVIINPSEPGQGHDGTASNPICYFNHPGETPIFECAALLPDEWNYNYGLFMMNADYMKFQGLTFRNIRQVVNNVVANGIYCQSCNGLTFTNMTVHNVGGYGFKGHNSDSIFYYNCDSFNCADTLNFVNGPGNSGAGFSFTSNESVYAGKLVYYYGCRAWNCSDDGFDGNNEGPNFYYRCWSWSNGYLANGAGCGYKFGFEDTDKPSRTITNCIAANNKFVGFNDNATASLKVKMDVYNNTAYENQFGFHVFIPLYNSDKENIYRNNISRNSSGDYFGGTYIHSNNSWDIPIAVSDADFNSVDYTEMLRPRKADGSLPDIDFMTLKAESNLIDAGIPVGLPYNDEAPDLGAWEYGSLTTPGNKYPSVEVTSPSNGDIFTSPVAITVTANASDVDGSISKVEFFDRETKLGERTSQPWSITWNNVLVGTHSLIAVATDNLDAKTTSLAVEIRVKSDIINLYPNPNNGIFTFVLKDPLRETGRITIVSFDGKVIYNGLMLQEELIKQFDLSYIKPGDYILILSRNEIIVTKKFIKE